MGHPATQSAGTPAEVGVAHAVWALERLWTAVRNYGPDHAAVQAAAASAVEVLKQGSRGELLTLRVMRGHFVDASDPQHAVPAELAMRLYDADVAAVAIAVDSLRPDELTHLVSEVGCRALSEASTRIDALIAENKLQSITLLRMCFDGLGAGAGNGDVSVWEQLTAQLLDPACTSFDATSFASTIEAAMQSGESETRVRDILADMASRARAAAGAEASASIGRLRSALGALSAETRAQLADVSSNISIQEIDRLSQFVDVLPLRDGIQCLQQVDMSGSTPAPAGVRMVQRMARVAAGSPDAMQELSKIAQRWAIDAKTTSHADALQEVARLLRVDDDQAYNPEEYDERLAEIAASLEGNARASVRATDDDDELRDHVALGLELLESPEAWEIDRVPVLRELGAVFAQEKSWEVPEAFFNLIERLIQIRTTAQAQEARTEANDMLERLLAAPSATLAFSSAGVVPEARRLLLMLASANLPPGIDVLARLQNQGLDEDTQEAVRQCIERLDADAIRDRISTSIKTGGGALASLLSLVPRLRSKDAQLILQTCLKHHDSTVRKTSMQIAGKCTKQVPTEWIHTGLRDAEQEVRRATVRFLAHQDDDVSTELLALHVMGDLGGTHLPKSEVDEAIDAIAAQKSANRDRCLAAIVGRAFSDPRIIRTGAPARAAFKLHGRKLGARDRLILAVWSVWPMRVFFRPSRSTNGTVQ